MPGGWAGHVGPVGNDVIQDAHWLIFSTVVVGPLVSIGCTCPLLVKSCLLVHLLKPAA